MLYFIFRQGDYYAGNIGTTSRHHVKPTSVMCAAKSISQKTPAHRPRLILSRFLV
jgi:hypothetical protein